MYKWGKSPFMCVWATSYGNNTNYTAYGANDVDVALFGGNNKSQAQAQAQAVAGALVHLYKPLLCVFECVYVCVCVGVCVWVCGSILLPVSDFNAFIFLEHKLLSFPGWVSFYFLLSTSFLLF